MIYEDYPPAVLEKAKRFHNNQMATVTMSEVSGYCFDEDLDVIWLEGSAQMALAYKTMHSQKKSEEILTELEKAFIPSTSIPEAKGLPYTANQGTPFGAAYLWDHADLKPALSSTIWYLFAKLNFNPLMVERFKAIPSNERFWNPPM